MLSTILAFLAFASPFAAAWILFRLFPASLMRFVGKEIDRRSDARLESMKAELQGAYSTLKTSVDVLTATNSGMHPHIVKAVSNLWSSMIDVRGKFETLIAFDTLMLADEADAAFSRGAHPNMLEYVCQFEGELHTNELFRTLNGTTLDADRLFCGDRLWLIYYVYRSLPMRVAVLINFSFGERRYRDWRNDPGVEQLLRSMFSLEDVKAFKATTSGGLSTALSRLEGEFLHEASRVMSGSKAMADSLGDVQAILLLQNAKVAEYAK